MQREKSLRSILIRNYAIIAIVPILLFGSVGINTTVSFIRRELNEKRLLLVKSLSFELDQYINHNVEVLKHLAAAAKPGDTVSEIQYHLNVTLLYFDSFSSVEIIDRNGIVKFISPYNPDIVGNDVSRQSYYTTARMQGGYALSKPFISPYTQSPALALTAFGHSYRYVGFLDLQELRNITEKFTIGTTGYAVIVDKNGYIIAHPDKSQVEERMNMGNLDIFRQAQKGKEGTFRYKFREEEKFGTIIQHPQTGWYLLIAQEESEANKPVRNIIFIFAVILGITIIISILLAMENRRKLVQPISSLMTAVRKIAGGSYSVELEYSGLAEINSLIRVLNQMLDTIEKRQEALYASTEQYRNLIEHAGSIIMRWNKDLRYTFVNSYALELFGFAEDELIGKPLIGTTHRKKDKAGKNIAGMLEDILLHPDIYRSNENEVVTRHGEWRWIQWSNKPIYNAEGEVKEILSIGTDRTMFKKAEQRISSSLQEKEILLKEIHHRVKNNMQIISSLLNLQSIKINDPGDLELFQASQNRVYSMSLIHEQLYESENLAEINFQDYIRELVSHISDTYLTPEDNINFDIKAENAFFGIDKAIPCALMVNELLSNAVKYAFPARPAAGKVEIILKHQQQYVLTVRDNGIGLPDGFDPKQPDGLGYQLITALIDQLEGELLAESDSGTVITITFS